MLEGVSRSREEGCDTTFVLERCGGGLRGGAELLEDRESCESNMPNADVLATVTAHAVVPGVNPRDVVVAIIGGTMLTLSTRPRLRWVERLTETPSPTGCGRNVP